MSDKTDARTAGELREELVREHLEVSFTGGPGGLSPIGLDSEAPALLDALLAQARREVLLEAVKAVCGDCWHGDSIQKLDGLFWHLDNHPHPCFAQRIHELLAESEGDEHAGN